jgi:hypothetical protein
MSPSPQLHTPGQTGCHLFGQGVANYICQMSASLDGVVQQRLHPIPHPIILGRLQLLP